MGNTAEQQRGQLQKVINGKLRRAPADSKSALERKVLDVFKNAFLAFIEGDGTSPLNPGDDRTPFVLSAGYLFSGASWKFKYGTDQEHVADQLSDWDFPFFENRATRTEKRADDKSAANSGPVDEASELYVRAASSWVAVAIAYSGFIENRITLAFYPADVKEAKKEFAKAMFKAVECLQAAYGDEDDSDHWEKQAECITIEALCKEIQKVFPDRTSRTYKKASNLAKEAAEDYDKA